jgi:hypothetical protein
MVFRAAVWSLLCGLAFSATAPSQGPPSASNAPRSTPSSLEPGSVSNGVYRNLSLGFTCKIPAGWVLRTEEMNSEEDDVAKDSGAATGSKSSRVLLAAFSRPPLARGEDVNASIVIAAESASAYPGLKEAAQYFGPITEVAKARGFEVDEEPYEYKLGAKILVRGDFEKNVGSRVMHQSTLVMLARRYAVSFTFIGGKEDEVDELIENLSFVPIVKSRR